MDPNNNSNNSENPLNPTPAPTSDNTPNPMPNNDFQATTPPVDPMGGSAMPSATTVPAQPASSFDPTGLAQNPIPSAPEPVMPESPVQPVTPSTDASPFQFQNPNPSTEPLPSVPPAPVGSMPEPLPQAPAAPQPALDVNQAAAPTAFNPFETPATPAENPVPESNPTDLSNLMTPQTESQSSSVPSYAATPPVPESLTVPSTAPVGNETAPVVTEGQGGFPKWIILVAVIVVLAVAGASAYFILGIGKPQEAVTTETTTTTTENTVSPSVTPQAFVPTPVESTSPATFNNLTGQEPASSPSGSATGSSAYQILKQKQSVVTPTPTTSI